jgi:hypothetical protein
LGRALPALEERIIARDTPGWEPGRAFEYLVLRAFELDGADVKYPYTAILLWRGDELEYALDRRAIGKGLLQKYRVRIEEGLPDYHIRLGDTP